MSPRNNYATCKHLTYCSSNTRITQYIEDYANTNVKQVLDNATVYLDQKLRVKCFITANNLYHVTEHLFTLN